MRALARKSGNKPEERESTDFSDDFEVVDTDEDEELNEDQDEFEDQRMSLGMQIKSSRTDKFGR